MTTKNTENTILKTFTIPTYNLELIPSFCKQFNGDVVSTKSINNHKEGHKTIISVRIPFSGIEDWNDAWSNDPSKQIKI